MAIMCLHDFAVIRGVITCSICGLCYPDGIERLTKGNTAEVESLVTFADKMATEDLLGGKKHDQGKPMMALLPQEALLEVAKVLTFGAERYGEWNWAKGLKFSRVLSAVYRHLAEVQQKNDLDSETGLRHTAHAICGLLFLLTYQIHGLGEDDRHDRNMRAPK